VTAAAAKPSHEAPPAAYRVVTPRLVLRCWNPSDAPALLQAISESLDHLRAWMPWSFQEPQTLQEKAKFLRKLRSRFDQNADFSYGIFDHQESRVIGAIGFHQRIGAGAGEIGYWLHVDKIRQGMMTEAAGALVKIGFELRQLRRIEVHCDPKNLGSAGVPRSLGFNHALIIPKCVREPTVHPRDTSVWVMTDDMYRSSRTNQAKLEAFDDLGQRLL
jgi:RimJ/RimL family protein N-acetyltransferase